MDVQHTIDLGDGHQIEIGAATWDNSETSVRNRYAKSNGGFDAHSSSEISLADLAEIVKAVARHDVLDVPTTARLLELLSASVARRSPVDESHALSHLLSRITPANSHSEIDSGPPVGNEAW